MYFLLQSPSFLSISLTSWCFLCNSITQPFSPVFCHPSYQIRSFILTVTFLHLVSPFSSSFKLFILTSCFHYPPLYLWRYFLGLLKIILSLLYYFCLLLCKFSFLFRFFLIRHYLIGIGIIALIHTISLQDKY